MKVAIILNCGRRINLPVKADAVVCADGGYDVCPVRPDVIVGDGDSRRKRADGITVVYHDPHKNETDGELAVKYAIDTLGADEIVLYGVLGGRFDHVLGNFALMSLAKKSGVNVRVEEEGLTIKLASGKFSSRSATGDVVSVVPYGGETLVSSYSGLEYPLIDLRLTPADARGISNVCTGDAFSLNISSGEALIFHYY